MTSCCWLGMRGTNSIQRESKWSSQRSFISSRSTTVSRHSFSLNKHSIVDVYQSKQHLFAYINPPRLVSSREHICATHRHLVTRPLRMAATMIRQAIKEETPLILQTATEATLNSGTPSSLAIGSMAANAARTAAVASVEAASSTATTGLGKMGADVVSREAGAVVGGELSVSLVLPFRVSNPHSFVPETSVLSSHLTAIKHTASHVNVSSSVTTTTTTVVETALPHAIPQPIITTATGTINPSTLTSSIARQALSKPLSSNTTSAGRGSTLARMDMNVAQSAETIKEAISNAVQEGLEEQLDKAMGMQKVTMAAGATSSSGVVAGGVSALA